MSNYLLVEKKRVLGIGITPRAAAIDLPYMVRSLSQRQQGLSVHFINTYNLFIYDKNDEYRSVMDMADISFCDGFPLAKAAKLLRVSNVSQVRGPDFFAKSLENGDQAGIRHFFIGGNEDTKTLILDRLGKLPVDVAGFEVPPFRQLSEAELAERDLAIQQSGATVIWVGLGTPKQDFEVQRLSNRHKAVVIAVGAAFDFYSGKKSEAPKAIQKTGLEWLFRLCTEPRRLWGRYLFGNSHFLSRLLVALVCRNNSRPR